METKQYTTIDRVAAGWPSGEWDGEPDKVQWPDAATGLPCLAVRHPHYGSWCGYVGVAESHPLHSKSYEEPDVRVHGGLTFADKCMDTDDESQRVCHVPSPGEPDNIWWFGFDCGHSGDCSPQDHKNAVRGYPFSIRADEQYRTLAYVQNECASLAEQLKAQS